MEPTLIFKKIKEYVDKNFDKNELVAHYVWEKYKDKLKLLLAIIISIRNKEETTKKIVDCFFDKFNNLEELEKIVDTTLESCLKQGGLWRQKLKWIKEIVKILKNKGLKILDDEKELIKLPGVGRKVLNVYLIISKNKNVIAVDTHVHRISNYLFVNTKTFEETEKELYKLIDRKYWKDINYVLILYGRHICKVKKPLCNLCVVKEYCKRFNYNNKHN